MDAKRILFITQEITPYLPETEISKICRNLPQGIQERGREIRTFMPKFGNINERRNQLHEPSAHYQGGIHPIRTHAGLFYRQ